MGVAVQPSLFESIDDPARGPRVSPLSGQVQRTDLGRDAWIDLCPGWLHGAQLLFERLLRGVDWHGEQRQMYDRVVDVPRLLRFYGAASRLPDPVIGSMRTALTDYYRGELGEAFATVGMCLYCDGRDSVAWHGDRIGRGATHDTMVAIVSVGAPRVLALRPSGGGAAIRCLLGHGDLLVMGGSCQRTWDHAIPKTRARIGPRISIQFRPRGVH